MQTATSEMESKSLDLSICVHHYTLRAPCPKGQGKQRLSHPPSRKKSIDQWAVDQVPFMTLTTSAKVGNI